MWSVVDFLKNFNGQQNYFRFPLLFTFIYISVNNFRLYKLSVLFSVVLKLLRRFGPCPVRPPLGLRGSSVLVHVATPVPQPRLSCPLIFTLSHFYTGFWEGT